MSYFKWSVERVVPTEDFKLILTFKSGEKRVFDARSMFADPCNEPLRDLSFFLKSHVVYGSVGWSEDIDIARKYLYEQSVPFED